MIKHRISVQTAKWFVEDKPAESMKFIKECGFEAVDYNINSLFRMTFDEEKLTSIFDKSIEELYEYYKPMKTALLENDIEVGQAHGILVIYRKGEPEKTEYLINATEKMIAVCAYIGCPAIVIHPWIGAAYGADKEEEISVNMWLYRRLMPAAKKYGVKICLENLWEKQNGVFVEAPCIHAKEACEYIDTLNAEAGEEVFCFCLDIGHTQFYEDDICNFISSLGKRLTVLHLHENDGIVDSHLAPYTQLSSCAIDKTIDWDQIINSLAEIQYEGTLSFETCNAIVGVSTEMKEIILRYISSVGRYFKKQLEGKKGHHLFE